MTSKELLEMAAKAAGMEYRSEAGYRVTGTGATGMPLLERWNPLTDDGDALRLAVRLELRIYTHCNQEMACASDIHVRVPPQLVPWGDDPCAATRRAIVRAAAEIGKAAP